MSKTLCAAALTVIFLFAGMTVGSTGEMRKDPKISGRVKATPERLLRGKAMYNPN